MRTCSSLGAVAMAYDLCHDGWDADYRRKAAAAIAGYDEGKFQTVLGEFEVDANLAAAKSYQLATPASVQ